MINRTAFIVFSVLLLIGINVHTQKNVVLDVHSDETTIDLRTFIGNNLLDGSHIQDKTELLAFLKSKGFQFDTINQSLYTIDLHSIMPSSPWYFHSKLGNYCTDYQILLIQSDTFSLSSYNHNEPHTRGSDIIQEASLPFILPQGPSQLYILSTDHFWKYREWQLISSTGLENHKRIVSTQIAIYLIAAFIFLVFALLAAYILNYPSLRAYALYLFATSLYTLIEVNASWFHGYYTLFDNAGFLNYSSYGILVLSFLIYTKSICQDHPNGSLLSLVYKTLIIGSAVMIFPLSLLPASQLSLLFVNLISIGGTLYFITETVRNFNQSIRIKFLLVGTMTFVLLGGLIDLHAQQWIDMPWIYYCILPGLILEFFLIGTGVIFDLKYKLTEINLVKQKNSKLHQNVFELEKKTDQAIGAYNLLLSTKQSGKLNLPQEYYKYPLTQRELQIVQYLDRGYSNQQMAQELHISRNTIKTHLKNIYKKLEVTGREAALEKLRSYGIV